MQLIVRELAEAVVDSHTFVNRRGEEECFHCNNEARRSGDIQHSAECIVTRAALLLEKEWGVSNETNAHSQIVDEFWAIANRIRMANSRLRNGLPPVLPVPPAGGERFPSRKDVCDQAYATAAAIPGSNAYTGAEVAYDAIAPHITRLQAEVERLKDRLADANAIANLAATNLEEFKEDHQKRDE